MAHDNKPPPVDDEDGPVSSTRPPPSPRGTPPGETGAALGETDDAASETGEAPGETDDPPSDTGDSLTDDDAAADETDDAPSEEGAPVPVTRELLTAFLSTQATRDRILEVVRARVPKGTQESDVDDIVQDASKRAFTARRLPRSASRMRAWVSRITQNAVIDFFRAQARDLVWLDREADVQELPRDEAMAEGAELVDADPTAPLRPVEQDDEASLHAYLRSRVTTKADRMTLEMVERQAATGGTNAAIAELFGISEGAYEQRKHRLYAKWSPAWEKHKRKRDRTLTLVILGLLGLIVAAILYAVLHGPKVEDARPTNERAPRRPAPSASAPPPDDRFNQAAPTDGGRLK